MEIAYILKREEVNIQYDIKEGGWLKEEIYIYLMHLKFLMNYITYL